MTDGSYRVGQWQSFLKSLRAADANTRIALSEQVSQVSNQLHDRHRHWKVPFSLGFSGEILLLLGAWLLLPSPYFWLKTLGFVALVLAMQPLIKVVTGLLLGVRYSHAYMWYFEPRFKMAYGTYMTREPWQKIIFQFAGSIGTPLAFFMGIWIYEDNTIFRLLCLAGFLVALGMQVGAFVAAWLGVRKVGPFLLSTLTTPATLANELRLISDR